MSVLVRFLEDDDSEILALTTANGFRVQDVTTPERRWRRSVITADDVEGDQEVQSVLDVGIVQVDVLVQGDSAWDIEENRQDLIAACEQRSYQLEVTTDDAMWTWRARRADSSTSDAVEWDGVTSRPMVLQVPVQPRPSAEQSVAS